MEGILESIIGSISSGGISMNFVSGGMGIAVYILQAIALYTIAVRREIKKPWMAWVPILNVWILGSISDQYRYVVKRQIRNKRKVLLGLNIALAVIIVLVVALVIAAIFAGLVSWEPLVESTGPVVKTASFVQTAGFAETSVLWNIIGALVAVALLAVPLAALFVLYNVFLYLVLYDVYCSCDPGKKTLFIVLSVVGNVNVVTSGAYALFLMLCKDKDLGMPPRKNRPQPEIVVEPAPNDTTPDQMDQSDFLCPTTEESLDN